jgi:hypothetical protein
MIGLGIPVRVEMLGHFLFFCFTADRLVQV